MLTEEFLQTLNKDTLIILLVSTEALKDSYVNKFDLLSYRVYHALMGNPEMITKVFPNLYLLTKLDAFHVIRTYLNINLPMTNELYNKGKNYDTTM